MNVNSHPHYSNSEEISDNSQNGIIEINDSKLKKELINRGYVFLQIQIQRFLVNFIEEVKKKERCKTRKKRFKSIKSRWWCLAMPVFDRNNTR